MFRRHMTIYLQAVLLFVICSLPPVILVRFDLYILYTKLNRTHLIGLCILDDICMLIIIIWPIYMIAWPIFIIIYYCYSYDIWQTAIGYRSTLYDKWRKTIGKIS